MEMSSLDVPPVLVNLADRSQVGEVRRLAAGLATRLGFDETDRGRVALVVTEAVTNAIQHGGGGELMLRPLAASPPGIEVLLVDKGPGIADVERALRDGYSTAGTPGTGFGAIGRQADLFDLYSIPGSGTVVLIQLWARQRETTERSESPGQQGSLTALEIGAINLPRSGETSCGDAWAVGRNGNRDLLLVADGLGHGPEAATAAAEAVRVFRSRLSLPPSDLLAEMHAALRPTRGAAVAVALLDRERREIHYAGVGNIGGSIVTPVETRSMVSHNGTVGHEVRKIQQFSYPWPTAALIIMQSDGLQSHWRLDRYPGLTARHPTLVAGLLYRDFSRGRDDLTILAAREATGNGKQ
jgi:anti-sigma regulatory factor (Ser/Thr protein kinase)